MVVVSRGSNQFDSHMTQIYFENPKSKNGIVNDVPVAIARVVACALREARLSPFTHHQSCGAWLGRKHSDWLWARSRRGPVAEFHRVSAVPLRGWFICDDANRQVRPLLEYISTSQLLTTIEFYDGYNRGDLMDRLLRASALNSNIVEVSAEENILPRPKTLTKFQTKNAFNSKNEGFRG
jgi:hypothetical protein